VIALFYRKINRIFPLSKLFKLLLGISASVVIIVLTYKHVAGFQVFNSTFSFIKHVILNTFTSLILAYLVAIPGILLIGFLDRYMSWNKLVFTRIIVQLTLAILLAFFASTIITLILYAIEPDKDLNSILVFNALISAVASIITMVILQAFIFFHDSDRAKKEAEILEKKLSQVRYEVLKNQINPHFMFNSLNVLSGLINKDVEKAQLFIAEFSQIYRYVLETIEKPVSSLSEELGFIRSYIFLQQIRYGDSLNFSVNLPSNLLNRFLPPLSLQTILENAIKHNIVNNSHPLFIDIYNDKEWLIIKNNIQPKISSNYSTGLGQKNLIKRYEMISDHVPKFLVEANFYIVKLPLISSDYDEGSDN